MRVIRVFKEWTRRVSATSLLVVVAVFSVIAVSSMVFSVLALQRSVAVEAAQTRLAAQASAVQAERRATQYSMCTLWDWARDNHPPAVTPQGKKRIAKAQERYELEGCAVVLTWPAPAPTQVPPRQ